MPIPKSYSSPVRMTAKERAFSQIQRWIIDGTLQPGEKLVDAELAEALGVSRTPVREALQLLEVQGLVEMHPGRDTRVQTVEKDDILKMYATLAALHSLAAETAATHISAEQIEQLKGLNADFAAAIKQGQPYQAMELDEQFHNLIVDASDNAYVASFSASLQIHIRRFKYVFLAQPVSATAASAEEHARIIEAFEKKDAALAASVMKQNLLRPMNELYAFIQNHSEGDDSK
ncbi:MULTISPECIES: GntR family transcriptional regulator [Paenibacillus]|uniref:GntR family transcriptional regulator n=1 Tax=Paenibacillus cineris TaxID=237530 RepID=A0ABQ4LMN4_9BACL|nr:MULTISPECIES: GntR family transcriptional regulator [Paenibacillus]MCM3001781.1 GntR family transcriptional regulator [Paenibacillus cellulositrophicus]RED31538.1 DNA-binding GntR family transcriptional regulator [Paenibacillus sp. VMFN-D1]GIO57776.1 GntR family transcriptional regulator [Paenibacillus cineris]GIO64641.1 GntR family transcriptional regulator [Paenibacillus cineris]